MSTWNKDGMGWPQKISNSGSFILKGVENKMFLSPSVPPFSGKKYSNLPGNPDGENHVKITLSIE